METRLGAVLNSLVFQYSKIFGIEETDFLKDQIGKRDPF